MTTFKERLASTFSVMALNRTQRAAALKEAEAAIAEIHQERLPAVDAEKIKVEDVIKGLEAELLNIDPLNLEYMKITEAIFQKLQKHRTHLELLGRKRNAIEEELAAHRQHFQRLHSDAKIAKWKALWSTLGNKSRSFDEHILAIAGVWGEMQEIRARLVATWPVGSPPLVDEGTLLTPDSLARAVSVAQYRVLGIEPLEKGKHRWPEPRCADIRNPIRDAAPTLQEAHEATTAFLFGLLDGPGVPVPAADEDDEQSAA